MMQPNEDQIQHIIGLIGKSLNGILSYAEQHELDSWVALSDENRKLFNELSNPLYRHEQLQEMAAFTDEDMALHTFLEKRKPGLTIRRSRLPKRIVAVAAAVAAIAFGVYFYSSRHSDADQNPTLTQYNNDIAPGSNRATLTANGKTINLSEAKTGVAINATAVTYNDGNEVAPSLRGGTTWQSQPLTVTTPRGGTYSVILQDGTKVWLNADSKLELLPIFWNKLQRIVKLTGEAYFEVAKILSPDGRDGRRPERVPFLVESQGQQVTVLGTHFNISAYKGEGIKTTLLEGSVSVRHLEGSAATRDLSYRRDDVVLKPNQQSLVTDNQKITVKNVDAAEVTAWKNGKFVFNSDDMNGLMRQVARWYNVEVVYQDNVQDVKLTGSISRFANISTLLDKLGQTGSVKFKLDGRTVTVMKAK